MSYYLIQNATVHSVVSDAGKYDVLVQDGLIKKVARSIKPREGMILINGEGQHLLPGFIDPHTHLGMYDEGIGVQGSDTNETSGPIMPHLRAIDSVYTQDIGFSDAVKYGITCVQVMPGSMNVIGGMASVLKTHGSDLKDMMVKEKSGLKIALGENPKKTHGLTRMGIMGLLREAFFEASRLRKAGESHPKYDAIIGALNKEYPVRIHAHRSDDILAAMRFAEEFDLQLCIEHCTEGHLVASSFEGFTGSVALGPTMTRRSKSELRNKSWEVYTLLKRAGVRFAIMTDHPYTPIQFLTQCAALSIREGLDPYDALKGITLHAAEHLQVADRVGTIEEGKDADLVLWTGHPFEYTSIPSMTMINGQIAYRK